MWLEKISKLLFDLFEFLFPRPETFYVKGRYLYDTHRKKVVLRGVNLPLLDDWESFTNFPTSTKLAEIAKTGANAVRIQWYVKYPPPKDPTQKPRPGYGLRDLDRVLDICRENGLIPILELHDLTCVKDVKRLNSELVPWWTQNTPGQLDVVTVLKRHRRYLIINLANELGVFDWAELPQTKATALNTFKVAYQNAVTALRAAGLHMPIMIDAPDCGRSIEAFTTIDLLDKYANRDPTKNVGQELTGFPFKNILLSVHAYWAGYDGLSKLAEAVRTDLPIVFGEIANKQDEVIQVVKNVDGVDRVEYETSWCHYALDGTTEKHPSNFQYQLLLQKLGELEIGWLGWAWWKDNCAARNMSDGTFAGLTPYGSDLVNNPSYGLLAGTYKAVRTPSLPGAPPPPLPP